VYLLAIQVKARFDVIQVKISAGQPKPQRILLVDDHPLVRRALKQALESEGDLSVCGEAEDREEALALVARSVPNLAIVDLSLKNSDGLDLVKDIRRQHPNVVTLVLSMHNESFHAERAIRAGANGYISKQEAPAEVMHAVRKVLGGEIYWPEKAAAETVNRLAGRGFSQSEGGASARLSERELQVFELIGIGSTPAQIAAIMDVEVSTVDTYRSRIKEKLSLKGANELRHEAIRWNVAKNAR
jgi:DNA-binding NarL/FixJ family response regulator